MLHENSRLYVIWTVPIFSMTMRIQLISCKLAEIFNLASHARPGSSFNRDENYGQKELCAILPLLPTHQAIKCCFLHYCTNIVDVYITVAISGAETLIISIYDKV